MLVTMVTNEIGDFPGFRAQVSQVSVGSIRGMNEDCLREPYVDGPATYKLS